MPCRSVATWALTALHVAAFAELGVLTRVYLDKLFQDGCTRGWGLCLTSAGSLMRTYGAYYTDLPSNMLGSFIMGCLATSSALGLAVDKAVGILPAAHPWQGNAPLLAGLRTGFCGSLTTFSAWQLQCVLLLVGGRGRQGGQWDQALWSIVIGLQTSLASLLMGHQTALAVHRWLLPEGRKAYQPDGAHPEALPAARRGRRALRFAAPGQQEAGAHPAAAATSMDSKAHSNGAGSTGGGDQDQQHAVASKSENGRQQPLTADDPARRAAEAPAAAANASVAQRQQAQQPVQRPADLQGGSVIGDASSGGPAMDADVWRRARREAEEEYGADEEGPDGASDEEAALERKSAADGALSRWHRGIKTHTAAAAALLLLTALFAALLAVDSRQSHAARRALWLSVLMGPPGALLRWLLADLNFAAPGAAAWFPFGTFAANLLACAVIFAMEVPVDVTTLGYWPQIVVTAVQKGFCGALSTVSTLVNEVHAMLEVYPDRFHAYTYPLGSIAAAWLSGLAIYGAAAWAHM